MTSEKPDSEAYVWIWLPGATEPVVAGRLARSGDRLDFNYGRSYLERAGRMAIYAPELPLVPGRQIPGPGLAMASCLRDASPDAWGQRVIMNRRFGSASRTMDVTTLDELTYLLESGSDRIGALDFQRSPRSYVPRHPVSASIDDLMTAADKVERGIPLSAELDQALFHGTSLGGARPKATIRQDDKSYIAKFSASGDVLNVVKGEYVAMRLAAHVGLSVAAVERVRSAGRDVILVQRFDRIEVDEGRVRKALVSALTLFGLDEMMARYASYEELCTIIRHRFRDPVATLRELFGRLVFNILIGNTDDHARNHAAFWTGQDLTLTPAYDICPQARSGNEASQAMLILGEDRRSRLSVCRRAASMFRLSAAEADAMIEAQTETIRSRWGEVCDEAEMSEVDRNAMWRRQVLNPYIFEDLPDHLASLGR